MRNQTTGRSILSGDAQLAQAILRLFVAGKPAALVAALDASSWGDATFLEMSENAGDTTGRARRDPRANKRTVTPYHTIQRAMQLGSLGI